VSRRSWTLGCLYVIMFVLSYRRAQCAELDCRALQSFRPWLCCPSPKQSLVCLPRKLSSGPGLTFARTGRTIGKPDCHWLSSVAVPHPKVAKDTSCANVFRAVPVSSHLMPILDKKALA
jgi:hypothetical protein